MTFTRRTICGALYVELDVVEQMANNPTWTTGIASPITPLSSSVSGAASLFAARIVPPRSIGREVRTGDQPSRP
jgi:hypothetical protein